MRANRILISVLTLIVGLLAMATNASAGVPNTTYSAEHPGADYIDFDVDVWAGGLPTTYWLEYFPASESTNCASPTTEELSSEIQSTIGVVSDNLDGWNSRTIRIDGLNPETTYCVSYLAENDDGFFTSIHWGNSTLGLVPTVDSFSPTATSDEIAFSLYMTPGTNWHDALVKVQYFELTDGTCEEYTGETEEYASYGAGYRGFDPVPVELSFSEENGEPLESGRTYCVRASGSNNYGDGTPTEWQIVNTLQPTQASIDGFSIAEPEAPEEGLYGRLLVTIDDLGAANDTEIASLLALTIHEVPASNCNATGYAGGNQVFHISEQEFGGSQPIDLKLFDLTVGSQYCVAVFIGSAWGEEYNNEAYFSFTAGEAPQLSNVNATSTHNSLTVDASVDAGFLQTEFVARYFVKPSGEACEDFTGDPLGQDGGTIAEGSGDPTPVQVSFGNLDPETTYCVGIAAVNLFGMVFEWDETTTGVTPPDTTPPNVPTGLAASGVSQTQATVSWDASSDDSGVADYLLKVNGTETVVTDTSWVIDLSCGVGSQVSVKARDTLGNVSAASPAITVTGEACDVQEQPPAPQPQTCFANAKAKNAVLKAGKKNVKLTATPRVSGDRQTVTIVAKGKGAKVTFKVGSVKVPTRKTSVTFDTSVSSVTVVFTVKKKSKSLKLSLPKAAC